MKIKFKFIDICDLLHYFSKNYSHLLSFNAVYKSCIIRELHTDTKYSDVTPHLKDAEGLNAIISYSLTSYPPLAGQVLLGYIDDERARTL